MTTSTTVYSAAAVDDQLAAQAASVATTCSTFGPTQPTTIPAGHEYVWLKTDGAGNLLDILSGVA